jgi:hypothetical protein
MMIRALDVVDGFRVGVAADIDQPPRQRRQGVNEAHREAVAQVVVPSLHVGVGDREIPELEQGEGVEQIQVGDPIGGEAGPRHRQPGDGVEVLSRPPSLVVLALSESVDNGAERGPLRPRHLLGDRAQMVIDVAGQLLR